MSYNNAQIHALAKEILGKDISPQEEDRIMGATQGGQESQVESYLRGQTGATSGSVGSYYGGGSSGSGASGGYPKWEFDFEAAQTKAFEKLKPYYEKILGIAKGDIALAKQLIEFDYKQGMRESKSEYELSARSYAMQFPQEMESFWTGMNRRGLIGGATEADPGGGLVGKEQARLKESQSIRQEAIERALENRKLRLEKSKELGLGREGLREEETVQRLGREHEKESSQMASLQSGIQRDIYGAQVGEWSAAEQRRLAEETRKAYESVGGGSSGGGGGGYDPNTLSQGQKQALWEQYGHSGIAPVGYGGG